MHRSSLALAISFLAACGSSKATTPAPAAPSGLAATGGAGQIALTWGAVSGATGYDVQRGDAAGGETHLASATTASFTDTGLGAGKTYFYIVRATNDGGASAASNEASATTAPAAPTGLTATGGEGQIALVWTAATGATSYVVSRATIAGGPYSEVATPSAPSYTDTGLAAGTTYDYVVQAVGGGVASGNSAEASAITAPPAPTGLSATSTDTSVTLQWTTASGATGYKVLRSSATVATTSGTSASESGLTPNTTYSYTVQASNASGISPDATVDATTAPAAPTLVSAAASNHHVTVSWNAAAGAGGAGYRVLRSTSASGPFSSVGTATDLQFTDTLLANGVAYSYVVHTIGGSGESGDSNVATATPFIEICALDAASNTVSVFDGTADGNVAPKRSFGWQTGVAGAAGVGTDGTNLYIASHFTKTVNVYPRTVSGNTAPTATLSVPAYVTALTVDATNSEIYAAAADGMVYVYPTSATGDATPSRTLQVGTTVSGLGLDLTHGQLFVLLNNTIVVYNRTDSGSSVSPQNTITPASPATAFSVLYGGAYDSIDDTIWVEWYSGSDASVYVASYLRTASGATSAAHSVNQTFSLNRPGGVFVQAGAAGTNYVWFATGTANSIFSYKHTSSSFALFTLVKGSNTQLYQPSYLALDGANSEFWVNNGHDGAEAFTITNSNGVVNATPQRSLDAFSTAILDPVALAVDRPNDELVERDFGPAASVNVYPRSGSGAPVPTRTITGPSTTLDAISQAGLAVDEDNGEYWLSEGQPSLVVFPRSQNGDGAPLRNITGNTNVASILAQPASFVYDPKAAQIVVSTQSTSAPTGGNILAWNRIDDGDVPPERNGTMDAANLALDTYTIDIVHDLIFSNLGTAVVTLPRAFGNGAVSQSYSLNIPADLMAVDGEGSEIYSFIGVHVATDVPSVSVFSSSSGSATAAVRTIQGDATRLYDVKSLIICN